VRHTAAERVSVDTPRLAGMTTIPDVIARYYAAAAKGDLDTVLDCFTPEAHVLDESQHYQGIAEIRRWRESVASRYTYTTEITGATKAGEGEYVVATHLEGDFPGGVVDLEQRFTVSGDLISELLI
jgi:ketosteroid isomerase-like protein